MTNSTKELRKQYEQLQNYQRELERRVKDERLRLYQPHTKQLAFHQSKKRNRWALGGNRTGKTECVAVEACWYARGNHPYKNIKTATQGWVVSLTNEVQRDVAQKRFIDLIISLGGRGGFATCYKDAKSILEGK